MKKNKTIFIVLFIFVIFAYSLVRLFAYPALVKAQEVALSISPPITELTIQPGKSFSQTVTVRNDGAPVVIVPKIFPFVPLDNSGHAEMIEDPTTVNVFADWFTFDPSPFSLGTTGSRDFIIKINPPATADEKDYYFTFIVQTQNNDSLGISSSQSQVRVGANFIINVSKDGNPQKKASIIQFSAPVIIDSFTGFTYKVVIRNSGASYFKPIGNITIDHIFGSTTKLNLAPLNILASGSREISCIDGEALIPCKLPGKFLIGIYRSNLSFTVDGSGSPIEKQIYTIAFPFTIIIGLATIFVIVGAIRKLTHLR
jgi:hypothetical protein